MRTPRSRQNTPVTSLPLSAIRATCFVRPQRSGRRVPDAGNSAVEKETIARHCDREQVSNPVRQKAFCFHCFPAEIRDIYRGDDEQWKRL
jgi:hypothetical protein